ncbi:unnamed protein product [Phytomonas sp. EM1]|nr:unnamed protein product [Phytomonas sp. EM1]|eukprot:CCW65278.1 unnamed protein product [Phytomonas sp. isolate EM1]
MVSNSIGGGYVIPAVLSSDTDLLRNITYVEPPLPFRPRATPQNDQSFSTSESMVSSPVTHLVSSDLHLRQIEQLSEYIATRMQALSSWVAKVPSAELNPDDPHSSPSSPPCKATLNLFQLGVSLVRGALITSYRTVQEDIFCSHQQFGSYCYGDESIASRVLCRVALDTEPDLLSGVLVAFMAYGVLYAPTCTVAATAAPALSSDALEPPKTSIDQACWVLHYVVIQLSRIMKVSTETITFDTDEVSASAWRIFLLRMGNLHSILTMIDFFAKQATLVSSFPPAFNLSTPPYTFECFHKLFHGRMADSLRGVISPSHVPSTVATESGGANNGVEPTCELESICTHLFKLLIESLRPWDLSWALINSSTNLRSLKIALESFPEDLMGTFQVIQKYFTDFPVLKSRVLDHRRICSVFFQVSQMVNSGFLDLPRLSEVDQRTRQLYYLPKLLTSPAQGPHDISESVSTTAPWLSDRGRGAPPEAKAWTPLVGNSKLPAPEFNALPGLKEIRRNDLGILSAEGSTRFQSVSKDPQLSSSSHLDNGLGEPISPLFWEDSVPILERTLSPCAGGNDHASVVRRCGGVDTTPQDFIGLVNLGNTCFLNSVTQLLFRSTHFERRLIQDVLKSVRDVLDCGSTPAAAPTAPARLESRQITRMSAMRHRYVKWSLGFLLAEMHWRLSQGYGDLSLNPKYFVDSLPALFTDGRQHDASEFSKVLLEQLDAEERDEQPGGVAAAAPTLVSEWFGGSLSTAMECLECRRVRFNTASFWDCSIPISNGVRAAPLCPSTPASSASSSGKGVRGSEAGGVEYHAEKGGVRAITVYGSVARTLGDSDRTPLPDDGTTHDAGATGVSLQALLDRVTDPTINAEVLDGLECEPCGRRTRTRLSTRILDCAPAATLRSREGVPHYLTLQLNRFTYEAETGRYEKILDPVILNEILLLLCFGAPGDDPAATSSFMGPCGHSFTPRRVLYRLRGFIIHSGSTPHSGHYFTIVKRRAGRGMTSEDRAQERAGMLEGAATAVHETSSSGNSTARSTLTYRQGAQVTPFYAKHWMMLNDSCVQPISEDVMHGVLSGSSGVYSSMEVPYIVLYERVEETDPLESDADGEEDALGGAEENAPTNRVEVALGHFHAHPQQHQHVELLNGKDPHREDPHDKQIYSRGANPLLSRILNDLPFPIRELFRQHVEQDLSSSNTSNFPTSSAEYIPVPLEGRVNRAAMHSISDGDAKKTVKRPPNRPDPPRGEEPLLSGSDSDDEEGGAGGKGFSIRRGDFLTDNSFSRPFL